METLSIWVSTLGNTERTAVTVADFYSIVKELVESYREDSFYTSELKSAKFTLERYNSETNKRKVLLSITYKAYMELERDSLI